MMLINLTGEPGAGKSTIAAGLFYRLKMRKWNVELVTEYTKELILTNDQWALADELVVFSEKYRRIKKLEKVDIVITDSSLINSVIYGHEQFGPAGSAFFEAVARSFDNIHFAVRRVVPYVALGRMPDEKAAAEAGQNIIAHVERINEPMWSVNGDNASLPGIVERVEREAQRRQLERLNPLSDPKIGLEEGVGTNLPEAVTRAAKMLDL